MVEIRALALGTQLLTQLLTPLASADIDDARALDIANDAQRMLQLILHITNNIGEVGACKTCAYDIGDLKPEVVHNIGRHDVGCRGRERQDRSLGLILPQLGDAKI